MSSISFDVFHLQLKLDAVGEPYRTVSIPSFYTFDKLHSIIQWLFQYSDEHQHSFKIAINKKQHREKEADYDSSSSLIQKLGDKPLHEKKEADATQTKRKESFYWVSDAKSFPSHSHIHPGLEYYHEKLESRVMLQNALHHVGDTIIYYYDFDSNINANWSVSIALISSKAIRNFPISDFDPFDFVEVIDGRGKTIPEYNLSDYTSDCERDYEIELREYNPKRLNEELQIMRTEYTMFYEDYKKNRKSKRKIKRNKKKISDHKEDARATPLDVVHDRDPADADSKEESDYIDATTDATIDETSASEDSSDYSTCSESEYTTQSDIYRYQQRNDYDHILMYSNKKKTKKNRQRSVKLCAGMLILLCILAWMLSRQMLIP